ncbi:MAG: bifunctional diguanylate cyclase/phosphodiesterase [Rhodanobacter sp.]|nr:MAG: bifunctional diguanylate cyclase/phosphodiesterase [Rhodanobacter sp.]
MADVDIGSERTVRSGLPAMLNRETIFSAILASLDPARSTGESLAVLFLRVQGLREFSLRCGHLHGERSAEQVQALIAQSLRSNDLVFRAGDESFALVLPDMRNPSHVWLAVARLTQLFEQPLQGVPAPWRGRAIIGVALHPQHGSDPDLLCRRAEMAMDEAQRRGERCVFYQLHETRVEIFYEELREAIETNKLCTWFQPISDLQSGDIVCVESLARWTSPRHGEVAPADFVPFAEQSDLISALTRWSINATLRQAASLHKSHGLSMAINFSPRVFAHPGMVEQLMGALEIWGVPPTAVVAEVTETALVSDLDMSVKVLGRIRDLGVRIAIDDFGTGYASIAYLSRFPATELKIDMSLVNDMRHHSRTAKLVQAIIDMAHHMDMTAIAEGIEDQQTHQMLVGMGCDLGQGYHLGRPEPAGEFVARFGSPRPAP